MNNDKFETLQLHVGRSSLTNTIRLSIGTKHIDVILADLKKGFAALLFYILSKKSTSNLNFCHLRFLFLHLY